jgi:flagellin-like hook-associated protein FlgL
MDTDYTAEVSNMIKNQIRQHVGTWLLAQVNKMPQLVLQLLK